MAENRNNILTHGMSGKIANQLVFKQYGDRTIVSKVPDMSRVKRSPKQTAANNKFREATIYARAQMTDPVAKAAYKAKATGMQRPYNVAIADFYSAPEIKNVDIPGHFKGKLTVHAIDDFSVVRVKVEIYTPDGALLEEGEASKLNEWYWEYKITGDYTGYPSLHCRISAWDKPGNMASKEVVVS